MKRAAGCVTLWILLLRLGGAGAAAAAPPQGTTFEVVARDPGARMERLSEDVYAIIHERATEEWPHGNSGVVVGSDAVLVIDSNYLPARAQADIELIRSVTDKPVRYLVNTHWHGDHTHGNGVYRDAFPGLTILGQRENRSFIELNLVKLPAGAIAPESAKRKALLDLEAKLSAAKEGGGEALSADAAAALARNVEERRAELRELAKVKVAPPNLLFDQELILELGGEQRVELRNQGRANSPNDVTIYLPRQRVLFTGDILVNPLPYVGGSFPGPWVEVLRRLEGIPVAALVPGHGPVMRDHTYTRTVREVFETARDRIEVLYRQGKNLEEAQKTVDLADQRRRFLNRQGNPYSEPVWQGWTKTLVERMTQCVHGYQC
jgi:glyoxylase-like metal-dependent hydrolase (beta-lactamase superfamily II)